MTCLCTGCWLYDLPHRRRVLGDLFGLGQGRMSAVFLAVTNADGQPAWEWGVSPSVEGRERAIVIVDKPNSWIERRGVFTMTAYEVSPALMAYVQTVLERAGAELEPGILLS